MKAVCLSKMLNLSVRRRQQHPHELKHPTNAILHSGIHVALGMKYHRHSNPSSRALISRSRTPLDVLGTEPCPYFLLSPCPPERRASLLSVGLFGRTGAGVAHEACHTGVQFVLMRTSLLVKKQEVATPSPQCQTVPHHSMWTAVSNTEWNKSVYARWKRFRQERWHHLLPPAASPPPPQTKPLAKPNIVFSSLFKNTRHRRLPRIQGRRRRRLKKYSSRGRRRRRGWGRGGGSGGGVEGGLGGQIAVEQGDSGSRSAVCCKVRAARFDRGYGVRRTLPSCTS